MNDDIYSDMAIEQSAKTNFGMKIEVDHVVARNIPVGYSAHATVFLTTKKLLMAHIEGPVKLQLKDVQKIISRMGLVAEIFMPPKGQPTYFDDIGREHFKKTFPGRSSLTDDDIRYYRTLAPYKPALVQILEVKHSQIYQFDTDSSNHWRPVAKFAYRRIRTS